MGIFLWLVPPKSPVAVILAVLLMFGLLIFPLSTAPWIQETLGRRLLTLTVLAGLLVLLAHHVWPQPEKVLTEEGIARAIREANTPERADIITTLVIDSVDGGKVKYHLEVKNGEIPATITDIVSRTPDLWAAEGVGGYIIPRNLGPGESLSIPGVPDAIPPDKDTNLNVQIGHDADIKGARKSFLSKYQFFITKPVKPQPIFPLSVSRGEGKITVDQVSAMLHAEFARPGSFIHFVLQEVQPDGTPNISVAVSEDRRFIFNPVTREVSFESKAQSSGQIMRVKLMLRSASDNQGLHSVTLEWSSNRAVLIVDGTKSEAIHPASK